MSTSLVTRQPVDPDAGGSPRDRARELLARPLTPYYLLLGSSALLLAIGLMMVLSASSVSAYEVQGSSYYWVIRQATWVAMAIPLGWLAMRLPLRVLRALSWPALLMAMALLVLTQTSLGVEVNGNQNWLALGPVQVQPAEVAKFALVLWCADVLARKDSLLHRGRHLIIPVIPVAGLVIALVLLGRDLGTSLVLLAIVFGLLWVVGVPVRVVGLAGLVIGCATFFMATRNEERMARITSFFDPFEQFHGSGWQAAHGILGMASGGLFGKGLGASQQKWGNLPGAHTDFIFAVLGEELGLLGTLVVLGLFVVLAYASLRVAMDAVDPFIRYATAGIVIWLMAHVLINIGMVVALLPVIGIPLPLVSYGGSSLVPELVALALVIGFARREPAAAEALALRRERRRAERQSLRAVRAGAVPRVDG